MSWTPACISWLRAPYRPWEAALWRELVELPVDLIPWEPAPTAQSNECHRNVAAYCAAAASTDTPARHIVGWAIALDDDDGSALMAFVHSVVARGNRIWCLTPSTIPVELDGALFVPFARDERLTWVKMRGGRSDLALRGRLLPPVIRSPEAVAEYKAWLWERRERPASAAALRGP